MKTEIGAKTVVDSMIFTMNAEYSQRGVDKCVRKVIPELFNVFRMTANIIKNPKCELLFSSALGFSTMMLLAENGTAFPDLKHIDSYEPTINIQLPSEQRFMFHIMECARKCGSHECDECQYHEMSVQFQNADDAFTEVIMGMDDIEQSVKLKSIMMFTLTVKALYRSICEANESDVILDDDIDYDLSRLNEMFGEKDDES